MKKIYIALAVLAAAALTSCVQEKSFNDTKLGKNDIAFILQTGSSTRSAEFDSPVTKGIIAPIGEIGNRTIYLEETVTDLSYSAPETRGVPVYTQNVGILYENKLGVYASAFGDATYESMDKEMVDNGWRYFHNYGASKWPDGDAEVDFFLRMPSDMVGISEDGFDYTDGAISFDYTSPATAAEQQDIIFAKTTLKESVYKKQYSTNGAPAFFYHALTAVKFAIDNDEDERDEKGIVVTGIKFIDLMNHGVCTVDPSAEEIVSWDADWTVIGTEISQSFTEAENVVNFDKTTHKDNNFADSFYSAGTEQNINKADASYTFWLIPQSFDAESTAILHIEYTMSGDEQYMDLPLSQVLNGVEWKAGQLRTYTIKLDEVNVMIDDEVTVKGDAIDGYTGSEKSNISITNTGTTPAFIRAAIVGQWLAPEVDKNNVIVGYNPVFGFTDEINNLYVVESWYEDQFVNKEREHGRFTQLPGYEDPQTVEDGNYTGSTLFHNWQLCEDGYYYYTEVVDPGEETGYPVFGTYTVGTIPNSSIAGQNIPHSDMHFRLEISTQAVSAVKTDGRKGSQYTWKEAWENALGEAPVEK